VRRQVTLEAISPAVPSRGPFHPGCPRSPVGSGAGGYSTAVLDRRVVKVTLPGRRSQAGPRYHASATTWIRRWVKARDSRFTIVRAWSVFDTPDLGTYRRNNNGRNTRRPMNATSTTKPTTTKQLPRPTPSRPLADPSCSPGRAVDQFAVAVEQGVVDRDGDRGWRRDEQTDRQPSQHEADGVRFPPGLGEEPVRPRPVQPVGQTSRDPHPRDCAGSHRAERSHDEGHERGEPRRAERAPAGLEHL